MQSTLVGVMFVLQCSSDLWANIPVYTAKETGKTVNFAASVTSGFDSLNRDD